MKEVLKRRQEDIAFVILGDISQVKAVAAREEVFKNTCAADNEDGIGIAADFGQLGDVATPSRGCMVRLRTMFWRPGNGLLMESKVARPMRMGWPSVVLLKNFKSSG
jgi:hypothetical protein